MRLRGQNVTDESNLRLSIAPEGRGFKKIKKNFLLFFLVPADFSLQPSFQVRLKLPTNFLQGLSNSSYIVYSLIIAAGNSNPISRDGYFSIKQ